VKPAHVVMAFVAAVIFAVVLLGVLFPMLGSASSTAGCEGVLESVVNTIAELPLGDAGHSGC